MGHKKFDVLSNYNFVNCIFTNNKVDMKSNMDVENVCCEGGFTYKNLTYNNQIHSSSIRVINKKDISIVEDADALITNLKNVPIMSFVADCASIGIIDIDKKVIATVHSGWRGTFEEIAIDTIKKMKETFDCDEKNIICILGPCINNCCYEVGYELIEKFRQKFGDVVNEFCTKNKDKYMFDLKGMNIHLLKKFGVDNIESIDDCTCCSKKYHSYRNDKTNKRMALVMELV